MEGTNMMEVVGGLGLVCIAFGEHSPPLSGELSGCGVAHAGGALYRACNFLSGSCRPAAFSTNPGNTYDKYHRDAIFQVTNDDAPLAAPQRANIPYISAYFVPLNQISTTQCTQT